MLFHSYTYGSIKQALAVRRHRILHWARCLGVHIQASLFILHVLNFVAQACISLANGRWLHLHLPLILRLSGVLHYLLFSAHRCGDADGR